MALKNSGEYEALARKYRPQTFADVVGQKHVISALTNSFNRQQIHHAYLLTGTRGIGKTTIARIMAKCLECQEKITATPCLQCENCREITDGIFPDVIEIDAASQTKVDDTRALLDNAQYPPSRGRYRIYIIDEVHMLSTSSFNALLKTLEEPPAYVKFILATTDPHKIPETVLSRCLQFSLKALTQQEICAQIKLICEKENIVFDDEGVALIARAAHGSMRDALSLCDQAVALGNGFIKGESVRGMLGIIGDGMVTTVLDLLKQGSALTVGDVLNQIHALSPDYRNLLNELVTLFHDLAVFKLTGGTRLEVFTFPLELLNAYAGAFGHDSIQLYYQICLQALEELRFAPDGATAFDMALLRLIAFTPEKKKIG